MEHAASYRSTTALAIENYLNSSTGEDSTTTMQRAHSASSPRRWLWWVCGGLVLAASVFYCSRSRDADASRVLDLSAIQFAREPAWVISRWTMDGDVQRAGFGVAQLHSLRELRLAFDRSEMQGAERVWRAHVYHARIRQSLVLGTESMLELQPAAPAFARIGTELAYRSTSAASLSDTQAIPRASSLLRPPSTGEGSKAMEAYEFRILALPARLYGAEPAPEQQVLWTLPEDGGVLALRWRAQFARELGGQRVRIEAAVEAQWWRARELQTGPPTREGHGRAGWEIDLGTQSFERFDMDLGLRFAADRPEDIELSSNARVQCELDWRVNDWPGRAQRGIYTFTRAICELLKHTGQRLHFGSLRWPPRCEQWFARSLVRSVRAAAWLLHP